MTAPFARKAVNAALHKMTRERVLEQLSALQRANDRRVAAGFVEYEAILRALVAASSGSASFKCAESAMARFVAREERANGDALRALVAIVALDSAPSPRLLRGHGPGQRGRAAPRGAPR